MVENGYGEKRDAEFAEAGGALEGADARVSYRGGLGGGADPLGIARAGAPGVHGFRCADEPVHGEVQDRAAGQATGVRACCGPRSGGSSAAKRGWNSFTTFATTSPSASDTKWRAASATCWCTARARRARFRRDTARFRRSTGRRGSRCLCPEAWGRRPGCWPAGTARCGKRSAASATARVGSGRGARAEQQKLEDRGNLVRSESRDGILEELPEAYKDVDEVIEVVRAAGLAGKVARLRPMGAIKG